MNLNDVALHGIRFLNLGHIEGELVAFYPPLTHRAITSLGTVNINKLLMEDLDFTNLGAFGMAIYTQSPPATNPSPGDVTISNAIFRDITNGASAATLFSWYSGATITLNGCITDENNVPALSSAGGGSTFTDNRDGPCADDFIYEFPGKRTLPTTDGDGDSGASRTSDTALSFTTCEDLAPGIVVRKRREGTFCQRVGGPGIGVASIVAAGFIDAVDVWGQVQAGTEVCFAGAAGSFYFLNAAYAPRAVSSLPAWGAPGLVCATINGAGTVVLMPGPPVAQRQAQPAQVQPQPAQDQDLAGCMVTTTAILNFRQSPAGDLLHFTDPWGARIAGWLPADVTLTALERREGWFRVDYHGTRGWISAGYVNAQGTCG